MEETYYDWSIPIIKILNFILLIVGAFALFSLIARYGFYTGDLFTEIINSFDLIVISFYFIQYILKLLFSKNKLVYIKVHWFQALIAFLILIDLLYLVRITGFDLLRKHFFNLGIIAFTQINIIIAQILIILSVIPGIIQYNQKINLLKFHPAQLLMISFLLVITIGTLLLMMPKAVSEPNKITFINALFTATSATCVTGLTVVDTEYFFSPLGQIIILLLIQTGGIGIITLSSFFTLFFGQGIGIKERVLLRDALSIDNIGLLISTLKKIIILVFTIESIGAIALMFIWSNQEWSLYKLIFNSIFHSVSAFCNAGFSTFSNNLMDYRNNVGIIFTITFLIIIGGIGFTVLTDLGNSRLFSFFKRKIKIKHRYKIQTKLALITSLILIVLGTICYLLFEKNNGNNFLSFLLDAYFTSVTTRTAGFNTINVVTISSPMLFMIIMLMFIGASPTSTGGGIKTTTIAVLWISIQSILSGKRRIILFKKNIPFVILNRALIIFCFSITLVCFATLILCVSEKFNFLDLMFETVSAYGTVGLSRGITAGLTMFGKSVIISLMFIGRIGILTLTYAITMTRDHQQKIEYPSEMVVVG